MERVGHPPDLLEHVLGSVHGDGKAEGTGDERYVASDDDGTRGLALALLATDSSNPVHHHYTHKKWCKPKWPWGELLTKEMVTLTLLLNSINAGSALLSWRIRSSVEEE